MTDDPADVAAADQLAAGVRETTAAMRFLAAQTGRPTAGKLLTNCPMPQWVADALAQHDVVFAAGQGLGCPHWRISPLRFMTMWRPGVIVCADCLEAVGPPNEAVAVRCDRCYKASPDALFPFAMQVQHPSLGAVMIWAALCRPCHTINEAELERK